MAANVEEAPAIANDFNREVRPFIDLVDRLRHFGLEQDISLPSIVVVGDQSSGKSSVLEALSGVQLPRGAGIVTRCPLELRMKSSGNDGTWHGRIHYKPIRHDFDNEEDDFGVDEEFDDPSEVEGRVRTAQNLLAGPDRGISSSRISLEITSPTVPDLTLIDLPGITRLAVHGQDNAVSTQIRTMIKEYICRKETIILAVVPANVDIATTEALQMAREVDREGKRTLGVVTKPDLVDRGAENELIEVVTNARYQLRRGYTLVKCRGQAAVASRMSLSEALLEEGDYFQNHPQLRNVPEAILGMRNLSKKLTSVLVEHIKEHLPVLKVEVREKLEKVNRDLARIGDGLPTERHELMIVFTRTLQAFTEALGRISNGDLRMEKDGNNHELNPFQKSRLAFTIFCEEVNAKIPKDHDKPFTKKIKERITQTRGRELPRFISYKVFEELIKELVKAFIQPAKICLAQVNDVIFETLNAVANRTVGEYRDLEREVKDRVHNMQLKARESCEKEIDKIFRQEDLVYTQDRTYSATYDCIQEIKHSDEAQMTRPRAPSIPKAMRKLTLLNENYSPEDHLEDEAEHTFEMIKSYMNVCSRRVCDTIPMMILYHMVKDLFDTIRSQIWGLLSEDPARLLSEEPELAITRQALRRKSERLQQAHQELHRF